jgi:hypothetical protein
MARSTTSSLYPSPPINRFQRGNVVLKMSLSNAATGAKQPNMCCPPTGGSTRLFIASNGF